MAKSINEEELQLRKRARRRLVGAIALVIAIVVFLPMVLDTEPKPQSQDIDIKIPSPNADSFISKIVPIGRSISILPPQPATAPPVAVAQSSAPAGTAPQSMPPLPPAAANNAAAQPIKKVEAAPPQVTEPAPVAKSEPAPTKSQTKKSEPLPKAVEKNKSPPKSKVEGKSTGNFVIQVAALNDAAKAKQMVEQLATAGVKAYTEVVPTVKGKVTRVRVGPFKSREEAEKVRDKLKSMGLSGNIVPQ